MARTRVTVHLGEYFDSESGPTEIDATVHREGNTALDVDWAHVQIGPVSFLARPDELAGILDRARDLLHDAITNTDEDAAVDQLGADIEAQGGIDDPASVKP